MAATGCFNLLVRSLSQVIDKKKPSRCGLKIISSLSFDEQVRFFFGKGNRLIQRVKEIMFKYPDHEAVQLDVLRAITNLSNRSKQAKHHFLAGENKVINGIFHTIQTHTNNTGLVIQALAALRNLCTVGMCQKSNSQNFTVKFVL